MPFIIPSWISALLPHLILIRVHPKTTLLSDEETKQSPFGPSAEERGLRGLRGGLGGMRARERVCRRLERHKQKAGGRRTWLCHASAEGPGTRAFRPPDPLPGTRGVARPLGSLWP